MKNILLAIFILIVLGISVGYTYEKTVIKEDFSVVNTEEPMDMDSDEI
ncbi:MAG: hypothetical protein AB203_02335 [Parcubacteria bacterium C7867-008]|nr:MAG: hypothetical protein AB203_02335 [Parcubacteria bacterium C7867-008]